MLQHMSLGEFSPQVRHVMAEAFPAAKLLTLGVRSYMVEGSAHFFTDAAHILVGRYSSIGHWIDFYIGMNHDYHRLTTYPINVLISDRIGTHEMPQDAHNSYQIVIGSDVWIGADVTIMSGVHIGSGAVIGAGTMVTKDVPPYAVVVGNPMRIIKYRFGEETVAALRRIKWWHWPEEEIEKYIPLFNEDLPGFLERFDPGLQEETDEAADAIHALRADGYTVSYFIPDFSAACDQAIWPQVIDGFLAAYTAADRAALVLAMPDLADADAHAQEITARIAGQGADAPLILSHLCAAGEEFSGAALSASNAYITTREAVCAHAFDYAVDAQIPIRYGRDQGALLFPPVR